MKLYIASIHLVAAAILSASPADAQEQPAAPGAEPNMEEMMKKAEAAGTPDSLKRMSICTSAPSAAR